MRRPSTCTSINPTSSDNGTCVTLLKAESGWTHPRAPVPHFLADAGVPESVWTKTFDEAACRQAHVEACWRDIKLLRLQSLLMRAFQIIFPIVFGFYLVGVYMLNAPDDNYALILGLSGFVAVVIYCLLPMKISRFILEYKEKLYEAPLAWQSLAEECQPQFLEFEIEVTAIQLPTPKNKGAFKQTPPVVGGLKFEHQTRPMDCSVTSVVQTVEDRLDILEENEISHTGEMA
jgi:hypothetical protein